MPLQFNGETNILEYIKEHIGGLKTIKHSGWTRADLFTMVKEVKDGNYYEVAKNIFKWGGIKNNNMDLFLAMPEDDVKTKLNNVYVLVKEDSIEDAFKLMYKGDKKLDGIGISFLTKILYFFDDSQKGEKALIFDKWSQAWHYAMLNKEQRRNWYKPSIIGNKNNICDERFKRGITELAVIEAYKDYMQRMKKYADEIGLKDTGKLEEFLFGRKRGKNQNVDNNPRCWLIDFIKKTQPSDKSINDTTKGESSNNYRSQTIKELNDVWEEFSSGLKKRKNCTNNNNDVVFDRFGCELASIKNDNELFRLFVANDNKQRFYCEFRKIGNVTIDNCIWAKKITETISKANKGKYIKSEDYRKNIDSDNVYVYRRYSSDEESKNDAIKLYNDILEYLQLNKNRLSNPL